MKANQMRTGERFLVQAGEFAGQLVTVVNPKPFPDDDLNRRRKVTVSLEGEEAPIYILPRFLAPAQAPKADVPAAVPSLDRVKVGAITHSDDPRLDPWRPSPDVVRQYLNRQMSNGMTDTEFLLTFWERRENLSLIGDTQSGKTMLVEVLAVLAGERLGRKPLPVFTLSGSSGVTNYEIYGQTAPFTGPDGVERLVDLPGIITLAALVDYGIVYFDELDHLPERVTSALHPVLDNRRCFVNSSKAVRSVVDGVETFMPEVIHVSEGTWFVSTTNPGYQGNSLGHALRNRFTHISWGYDPKIEEKLIPSKTVRQLGAALREARAKRVISTPIGTSLLAGTCRHAMQYGVALALDMLMAAFPEKEQAAVEAIITDRSFRTLLHDEENARIKAEEDRQAKLQAKRDAALDATLPL